MPSLYNLVDFFTITPCQKESVYVTLSPAESLKKKKLKRVACFECG